jgi:hypothetical protein
MSQILHKWFQLILLSGKACFVCEDDSSTRAPSVNDEDSMCSKGGPRTQLVRGSNAQRVLEHMGAHILHDPSVDRSQELCGLCLRPAPTCLIFLKKGRGAAAGHSVDLSRSTCINLMRFKYATASNSSETSPCSNSPRICPLCPVNSPAVWSYNLEPHFHSRHNLLSEINYPLKFQLSVSETEGLLKKWKSRFKIRERRNLKKSKKLPLSISEAHSSRLALR